MKDTDRAPGVKDTDRAPGGALLYLTSLCVGSILRNVCLLDKVVCLTRLDLSLFF